MDAPRKHGASGGPTRRKVLVTALAAGAGVASARILGLRNLGTPASVDSVDAMAAVDPMGMYDVGVDDAADVMQLGIEKQENVRKGIDLMASRTKDFLPILQKYSANGPELEIYKDNLDDAIEGTQDAMNDAEKAKKKVAPSPIRRKH